MSKNIESIHKVSEGEATQYNDTQNRHCSIIHLIATLGINEIHQNTTKNKNLESLCWVVQFYIHMLSMLNAAMLRIFMLNVVALIKRF